VWWQELEDWCHATAEMAVANTQRGKCRCHWRFVLVSLRLERSGRENHLQGLGPEIGLGSREGAKDAKKDGRWVGADTRGFSASTGRPTKARDNAREDR
jgi:hypothetical protein